MDPKVETKGKGKGKGWGGPPPKGGGKGNGWSKGKGCGKGGNGKGKGMWSLDDNQWPILSGQSASNQGFPQEYLSSLNAEHGSESWDSYGGDWVYYEDPGRCGLNTIVCRRWPLRPAVNPGLRRCECQCLLSA